MNIRSIMFYIVAILSAPTLAVADEKGPLLPPPDNAVTEPLASHLRINGLDMRAVIFMMVPKKFIETPLEMVSSCVAT